MKKNEIVQKVKELNLPTSEYIVFGSSPLAVAGIREAHDIDILVSSKVLEGLRQAGWAPVDEQRDDRLLARGVFEVHDNWNFNEYRPTLEGLLKTADIIDGVPFASLNDTKQWKAACGRPKDLHDIELIDAHLQAGEDHTQ